MARGAWESTAQQEAWQVPGLFAEAARLGSGIMQLAKAGSPDQIRAAERLLERTRRELYRILADDAAPADDEQDRLTVKTGAMKAGAMNENIRISDADRDHVVERLREHFADGRLTSDELDERVTATLSAKTYGDLRAVLADLPEPQPVGAPGPGAAHPGAAGPLGRKAGSHRPGPLAAVR